MEGCDGERTGRVGVGAWVPKGEREEVGGLPIGDQGLLGLRER